MRYFKGIRSFILPNIIVLFLFANNGCSTNPATGERHFNLISESEEIKLGQESDKQIVAQMGVYNNPGLQSYVEQLGKRIAATSERPNLPWTFRVLDDDVVNAFALPGGYVYVTRGILTHLNNEAELAGVLGHEIGHVTAKHSVYTMSSQQLTQLGLGVAMVVKPELQQYAGLASTGLQLLYLKYSRDDERQADNLGLRYMRKINEDPRQMIEVMKTLDRVSKQEGGSGSPQWLSTHPDPGNRIELIQQDINSKNENFSGYAVNKEQYFAKLDGTVYGKNPEQGFFKGNIFYQPELNFQIAFPVGWNYANGSRSVTAVSPNKDAVMELSLSDQSAADAAARNFFQQQGITGSDLQKITINGNAAVSGEFTASTDNGALYGNASFITYGGKVYQVLSYSSQPVWGSYSSALISSVKTFQKLGNASYKNAEPKKIKIITVNQAMTLQEFNNKYPSTVPLATVAIINQMDANTRIEAGQKVKQVTGQGTP